MSAVARGVTAVSVGGVVAAGVFAVLGGPAPVDGPLPRNHAPPGDRVLEAVEGLRDDRVHVTRDGRGLLGEEDEARVAEAIAARDLPVHVVVWRSSWKAGYSHDGQATDQLVAALDEPAVVVLWQGADASRSEVSPGWSVVDREEDRYVEDEPEYLGDAATRLLEWLEQLPDEPLRRDAPD